MNRDPKPIFAFGQTGYSVKHVWPICKMCRHEFGGASVNDRRPPQLSRAELYEVVWSLSMKTLAARYGVSDVALAKLCRPIGRAHRCLGSCGGRLGPRRNSWNNSFGYRLSASSPTQPDSADVEALTCKALTCNRTQ